MTSGVSEAFGFVPAHVVADLQDIGNWKSRATAIDALHKCLKDVARPAVLLPALGDFVKFLAGLVADPNFKIAISSMSILGDLAAKVGSELGPHLRVVSPALLEKFADSKVLVRGANMKVIQKLMHTCSPGALLAVLAAGSAHSNWRVREEVVNTHIMAMLSFGRTSYDSTAVYRLLSDGLSDGNDRVRLVALEGLAVLNSRLGSGELAAMIGGGHRGAGGGALPEPLRSQVSARLANKALPTTNEDGMVQHVVDLLNADSGNSDVRQGDAALGSANGGGKTSWGDVATPARPRIRNAGGAADGPMQAGGRPGYPAPSLEQAGRLGSDPLPGSRRDAMQHVDGSRGAPYQPQQEDSGSYSLSYRSTNTQQQQQPYAATPSRFGSHEALSGGAPIVSAPALSATGWSSGHPAGRHARSPLPDRSVSPLREVAPSGHAGLSLLPADNMQERNSGAAHAAANMLQPLKHHWGGTGDTSRDSLDMLAARPASVRTAAAQELLEARGPPIHAHTHPPAQVVPQPHGGSNPSSTGLWLQSSLEQDNAAMRQETFSPSKAEMLARLKNRQIEKRAATAQQDASFGSSSSELYVAQNDTQSFSAPQNPRRYLFTQLSDHQRDRGGDRSDASRGYNSALNTPTRAHAPSPFDATPQSAQSHRPLRGGLAARLGRGAPMDTAGPAVVVGQTRSPPLPGAHASPSPSDDSSGRNPSPALNRLRVRSADPNPAPPGGGASMVPASPIANGSNGAFWDKSRTAEVAVDELTPVPEPERHIKLVISRLIEANHADRKELNWQGQYDALMDARRLVKYHLDVVRSCLHDFVRAATPAIDQLRSQTSKCALALFQECFFVLGRTLDRELDEIVPVLIKKAGEVSNAGRDNFLAAEADRVLGEMYRCCGEAKCLTALLACAGHKNPYVRGKVAYHLDNHLEACAGGGGRQALASNSACMERLFKAAAAFLNEGSLETRTYGKRIIWHVKTMLSSRAEFDRLLAGVAPESLHRKVVDVVEGLNGPPPPPSRGVAGAATASAGGAVGSRLASRQLGPAGAPASPSRPILDQVAGSLTQPPPPVRQCSYSAPLPQHHPGAATPERRRLGGQRTTDLDGIPEGGGNSRNNSSNGRQARVSAGAGGGAAVNGPVRTRYAASADGTTGTGTGFGPVVQETVVKALQLLNAKDFRERMDALRSVEAVIPALPGAPDSLLVPLLDALIARLGDANSKVSMVALELMSGLALALRQRICLALNTLVPALAGALGSANDKIRAVAIAATDALLSTLDPAMLVQHFSHCVGNGTLQRGKPILVEKLVMIVNTLYGSKPQLVVRYAVPAAFALLNDSRGGEAKVAANALLGALARLMGMALVDQAGMLNAVAQQRVADAVAAATGQPVGSGERDRDRTPRVGRAMA